MRELRLLSYADAGYGLGRTEFGQIPGPPQSGCGFGPATSVFVKIATNPPTSAAQVHILPLCLGASELPIQTTDFTGATPEYDIAGNLFQSLFYGVTVETNSMLGYLAMEITPGMIFQHLQLTIELSPKAAMTSITSQLTVQAPTPWLASWGEALNKALTDASQQFGLLSPPSATIKGNQAIVTMTFNPSGAGGITSGKIAGFILLGLAVLTIVFLITYNVIYAPKSFAPKCVTNGQTVVGCSRCQCVDAAGNPLTGFVCTSDEQCIPPAPKPPPAPEILDQFKNIIIAVAAGGVVIAVIGLIKK